MNKFLIFLDSSPTAILKMKLRIDKARKQGLERNVKSLTTRLHLMKMKADSLEEKKWRNDNKPAPPSIKRGLQYQIIEIIRPVAWKAVA